MKKLIMSTLAISSLVSSAVYAYSEYSKTDTTALFKTLSANAAKVPKEQEVAKHITYTAKSPTNAEVSYITEKRAAGGKLEMHKWLENGLYWYDKPDVCDIESAEKVVKARCPNTFGFAKFVLVYDSGTPSEHVDNFEETFAADNQWHTIKVQYEPHYSNRIWANVQIVPLF